MKKIILLAFITALSGQLSYQSDFERNVFKKWQAAQKQFKIKFDKSKKSDYQNDDSNMMHKISFKDKVVLMRRLLPNDSYLDSHLAFIGGRLLYILETYHKRYMDQLTDIYKLKILDKISLDQFYKKKPKFQNVMFEETKSSYIIKFLFKGITISIETASKNIPSTERFYLPLEEQQYARIILSNQLSKSSITINTGKNNPDFGLYRGYEFATEDTDMDNINFKGNVFEPTRSQEQFIRLMRTKNQSINRIARQFDKIHVQIKTIYKPSTKVIEGQEAIKTFLTNMMNGYEVYAYATKQDREELSSVILIKEPYYIFYHQIFIKKRFDKEFDFVVYPCIKDDNITSEELFK